MKKQHIYKIAFLILIISSVFCVKAQHPKLNVVEPPEGFDYFPTIKSIEQDQQGFIWLATLNGLYRYDGKNYITYNHNPNDSNSIAGNAILSICVAKNGIIWLGLQEQGLNRFDPATKSFTHFSFDSKNSGNIQGNTITSLLEDKDENLWIGTLDGLHMLQPETETFITYQSEPGDSSSLSNNQISTLYEDKQGTLWVGTGPLWANKGTQKVGGLNRFIPESKSFKRYMHNPNDSNSLINNSIKAISEDSNGNFWIGTMDSGLHTMDRKTGKFTRYIYNPLQPENLSAPPNRSRRKTDWINFIHEDISGALWIGTYVSGLTRYNPETKKAIHYSARSDNPLGLITNYFWDAFTSMEGELWISSGWLGTLFCYDPLSIHFDFYPTDTIPWGFTEDNSGNMWINTLGCLRIYENFEEGKRNTDLEAQIRSMVKNDFNYYAHQGKNGDMLLFGDDKLHRLNLQTGNLSTYPYTGSDSLNIPNLGFVSCLLEDKDGLLWIGFRDGVGGLNRLDPKTGIITRYRKKPNGISSISSQNITSICEDSAGNIWIGTNSFGINKLDKNNRTFKRYLAGIHQGVLVNSAPLNTVYDILEDNKRKLWIGTNRGLYYYNSEQDDFVPYLDTITGKKFPSPLFDIEQDKQKNLWLLFKDGFHKLDSNGVYLSTYAQESGVTMNGQVFDIETDKSGRFYWRDPKGFHSFNPNKLKTNTHPPQISLSNLSFFEENVSVSAITGSLNQGKNVILEHKQNSFSIEYSVLHYTNPSQNTSSYKLENYDNIWHQSGKKNLASYYKVPPGKYVFRVKAASSSGVRNEKVINIIIHPPWWRTWLAYIIYFMVFTLLVWYVYSFQRKRLIQAERLKSQQKELKQAKEIEKAYTELKATQSQLIQSEKMASLGELTAGIAHEIQNPLNFVNNFSEVSKELIVEMKEEINNKNFEEVEEISQDIDNNLEKIYHHGKRAEAIVKGMLQHSRTSSGERELTDINALADEYLRLSYHGLRAKDKSFNADFKTEFDESLPKINIIPQDIGRVLLNLINNAFYAVSKARSSKLEAGSKNYKPEVSVSTKKTDETIEIRVSDNGPGIPPEIKDKIFQPFFTTKPTGSGTGLGLSLSYDIVKAHGGEIKVESLSADEAGTESIGTEFLITIPYNLL